MGRRASKKHLKVEQEKRAALAAFRREPHAMCVIFTEPEDTSGHYWLKISRDEEPPDVIGCQGSAHILKQRILDGYCEELDRVWDGREETPSHMNPWMKPPTLAK